jgi:hypothetical protein
MSCATPATGQRRGSSSSGRSQTARKHSIVNRSGILTQTPRTTFLKTQQSPGPEPRAFVCSADLPADWGQRCHRDACEQPRSRDQGLNSLVVGRSCRRWHLGPGVEGDVPLSPGHLRRRSGRRDNVARGGHQRSVESVGAGAGSSARSSLVLRGGVVHQWRLRIPMCSRWIRQRALATAKAASTLLFIQRNRYS